MADETRRQRRDARRAADEQPATPGRIVPQPAAAGGGGAGDPVVAAGGAGSGGRRRFGFVQESIAELRKVEWPTRAQVVQGTLVVLVACVVVGLFLYLADLGLKPLVRDVLLNS